MLVQAVIFDFGGVLSIPDDAAAWQAHLDEMGAELGFESGAAMWSHLYEGDEWWLAKTGRISEGEFWKRLLEPLGLVDLASRRKWVRRLFDSFDGVHPHMRQLLERLKGQY